ncbi:TAXI family TRAP transporter solute-binding subunit [Bacillus sp. ISL-45]|uniref:TAXI family TRAP transporter solute-binding subunit n=1 Tax=Bacillus sp. ISL-45 TaxID=2819128 RepID=UPI001BE89B22|nr:TAXI family TRAP transporter solute-binding subunit [Bacillus sp. ISL-45]MBT2661648.1 TAXI family TRAP transporter solute-binding subunit [Bacillus sp. ISL-45]
MRKYSGLLLILVLIFSALLMGCAATNQSSGNSNESASENDKGNKNTGKDVQISFGGSAPGGVYFYMVGVLANLLSEELPGINVTNVSTGASVANVIGIANGELDFGLTYGSLIKEAWNGTDTFKDQGEQKMIRGIAKAYESPHYFVAMKDSGITSMADLKGKKVSVGPPGSGAQYNTDIILNILGIDVKREFLSFADAGTALKEGRIDAFGQSGAPSGAVTELAETSDIVIIPFSDEEMDQLEKETGFYTTGQLKANTYKGIDQEIQMPMFTVYWIAHKDVDDETVEKILEVAMDENNRKTLVDGYPLWSELTPDIENFEKLGVPFHPGAVNYYNKNNLK